MPKLILIGIDGFDPFISDRLMKEGKLINFSYLKTNGSYSRLRTANPAQSPVVWSSIATGTNPGRHGLFDFIYRNPDDYLPRLSILKPNRKNILGKRSLMFNPVRQSVPFWSITSDNNIKTTVIKWPISFPVEKISGKMLSGLGTPDLKTSLGRYIFYSTRDFTDKSDKKGDIIKITIENGLIKTYIPGPNNSKLNLNIRTDLEKRSVNLEIEGENYILKENKWSDWIGLKFKINIAQKVSGIVKFYLDSLEPEINIYVSSINIDPKEPAFPISEPDSFSRELASKVGRYHTLGQPEETNGLVDECFSEEGFLDFIENIQREKEKIFWQEFSNFEEGVFAFVFDVSDRLQHIFWNGMDPEHPLYNTGNSEKYQKIIFDHYCQMDEIIGQVLKSISPKDLLIVVSDHGFSSFRRAINLNSWLIGKGLMVLKSGNVGLPLFENIDWKKTKAYALGFSSIYLNISGREKYGIVNSDGESEKLSRDIIRELRELKDYKNQKKVISSAYLAKEIYKGPCLSRAPDIIAGTNPGYRVSWQTAVGSAPENIIEDNLKKWTGDHLIDPQYVPGVLFINKKIEKQNPSVFDIFPTILNYFQISQLDNPEGDNLL